MLVAREGEVLLGGQAFASWVISFEKSHGLGKIVCDIGQLNRPEAATCLLSRITVEGC